MLHNEHLKPNMRQHLPVQCVCSSSVPFSAPCDPHRDFHFPCTLTNFLSAQTPPSPWTPLAPLTVLSPGPLSSANHLAAYTLTHTHTLLDRALFQQSNHTVLHHLLSTLPAVAHSLPAQQNNSPTMQWHAHRTEITQGCVCQLETEPCLVSSQFAGRVSCQPGRTDTCQQIALLWSDAYWWAVYLMRHT